MKNELLQFEYDIDFAKYPSIDRRFGVVFAYTKEQAQKLIKKELGFEIPLDCISKGFEIVLKPMVFASYEEGY